MNILKNSPNPVSIETTDKISTQLKKCICLISNDKAKGTGFFCNIPYKNGKLSVLITSNHILDRNILNKMEDIIIEINNEKKNIHINDNRKIYANELYDTTIIEIKRDKDLINDFLEIDEEIIKNDEQKILSEESIYTLQYLNDKPYVSYGILRRINKNKSLSFFHLCNTNEGSIGSPILNLSNCKVIGMHRGFNSVYEYNIGIFLNNQFNDFNNGNNLVENYKDTDFENLKLISGGSYGDIYFGYNKKDNLEICLKKINLEKMRINYEQSGLIHYQEDINNEIKILSLLSNYENSVKYYGNYDKENEKNIIMEKCDKDLKKYISERGKGLSVEEIKNKFIGINEVFKKIQQYKIIHRDLKLENFLIKYNKEKTDYIIKLADYGIGKFQSLSIGIFSGLKGTGETMAPEILLNKTQTFESIVDIFSLGIIFYQLSHNLKHPFGKELFEIMYIYKSNYEKDNFKIEFDKSIKDESFKDLITKMIRLNPKNRINWENYFNHHFFK